MSNTPKRYRLKGRVETIPEWCKIFPYMLGMDFSDPKHGFELIEEKERKEEILKEVANNHSYEDWGEYMHDTHPHTQEEAAMEAMDIWAKQYGNWLLKKCFPGMLPVNDNPRENDELYDLYIKSKQK